jgi:hypothetical protein
VPSSQWTEAVRVFNRDKALDQGLPSNTYVFVHSGEVDGAFAMSRGVPSGRDAIIAGQRDHKADAVFCCDDETPVSDESLLRDLEDKRLYRVLKREHNRRTGEFVLLAEASALDSDDSVVLVGEP